MVLKLRFSFCATRWIADIFLTLEISLRIITLPSRTSRVCKFSANFLASTRRAYFLRHVACNYRAGYLISFTLSCHFQCLLFLRVYAHQCTLDVKHSLNKKMSRQFNRSCVSHACTCDVIAIRALHTYVL